MKIVSVRRQLLVPLVPISERTAGAALDPITSTTTNPRIIQFAPSKNISRQGPRNCRSLHGTPHGQPGQAGQVARPQVSKARPGAPFDCCQRSELVILIKAGASVLPQLRRALPLSDTASQARIIRILGWQGERESLTLLHQLQQANPQNKVLIAWAIEKIEVLRFQPWTN